MNRKKIALIIDVKDWAFDIEARLLQKSLNEYYEIDVFEAESSKYNNDLYLILEDTKNYDIIHFFWRKLLLQFDSDEFKKHIEENNLNYSSYVQDVSLKISTGIYDHLFLDDENINTFIPVFTKYCKQYYTCSKKLEKIYSSIASYKNPWGTIHDTYDNKLFKCGNKKLEDLDGSPLVVGWVGNSNWNIKYKDFKGFHSILNPVLDELINEGYNIKKDFADKNIVFRPNNEMPEYYKGIDVCIITSINEGTPRPTLEAMACGVPVITTNVGICEEIFGPKQSEFIIGSREILDDEVIKNKLKNKIKLLYNNKDLLVALSKENCIYSKYNDIDHTYLTYKQYFDDFLSE